MRVPVPALALRGAVDYGKKIEEAQKNGDITAVAYYTRLKAQAEAEAKGE